MSIQPLFSHSFLAVVLVLSLTAIDSVQAAGTNLLCVPYSPNDNLNVLQSSLAAAALVQLEYLETLQTPTKAFPAYCFRVVTATHEPDAIANDRLRNAPEVKLNGAGGSVSIAELGIVGAQLTDPAGTSRQQSFVVGDFSTLHFALVVSLGALLFISLIALVICACRKGKVSKEQNLYTSDYQTEEGQMADIELEDGTINDGPALGPDAAAPTKINPYRTLRPIQDEAVLMNSDVAAVLPCFRVDPVVIERLRHSGYMNMVQLQTLSTDDLDRVLSSVDPDPVARSRIEIAVLSYPCVHG
jgi:hypothetical protein